MFRFHKTLDVITLFHKASSPASLRAHALLKQAAANASETATIDQAGDHSAQTHPKRAEFELEVTEAAPTPDQLRSILEYLGASKVGSLVTGAKDEADAVRKIQANGDSFVRPVTVDWGNGKAVMGANESEILKMVNAIPKD
ncbi:Thioredoxin-like fold protein [Rutstroemia sp. NJR-2017a WRK4]|nr:Thioredoxin-like fold protein [Rutstroemia sp. NJR-2017a WRK4]